MSEKQQVVREIDLDTGEEMEADPERWGIVDLEQQRRRREAINKKRKREQGIELGEKARQTENQFVWEIYELSKKHLSGISPSSMTRLIFLSTYLSYDGYLSYTKRTPITPEIAMKFLKVSEREYYYFWDEMLKAKIMYLKEGKIYVDQQRFRRGVIKRKDLLAMSEKGLYLTRIYIDGVRQLYDKATKRSHKTLSYIFQILPFVNREFNIVCHNPLEIDLSKIERMSLGEFCDIIGYSRNNASRLCKLLLEPSFLVKGKEQGAIRYVVDKSLKKETYNIFVNPKVYYAGSDYKQVEILGAFSE